ncbi:DNA alkylation repair protein [Prevotella sp. A2931]|uniref:DNA alkylation repair protein n=1 Tax=Prevotella illustrans TaxID=2800387 RepID=A0ABS3M2V4_9BACT|nr:MULTISPECIES: DNA alkylation repair protein [Prevotella]MBO1362466.1 DNA alkylation repair protein [Prevotella illustrans]PTL25025.1 peptidase [Prevotella sp. oral taxon 820]
MDQELKQKINTIKQSFRLYMNGPASQSMREKGVNYKLNWGVSFADLKRQALEYGKDRALAIELWKENIRECRILATLIMPAEEFPQEIAEIWMEQVDTPELANLYAFNLLQETKYAPVLAFQWIAYGKPLYEICAYTLLGHLFQKRMTPNERGINEFLDQAAVALRSENSLVRHAVYNCVVKFEEMDDAYRLLARKTLGDILD